MLTTALIMALAAAALVRSLRTVSRQRRPRLRVIAVVHPGRQRPRDDATGMVGPDTNGSDADRVA